MTRRRTPLRIALLVGLVLALAYLAVLLAPLIVALALVPRTLGRRPGLLAGALLGLLGGWWARGRRVHPCLQCGVPIDGRSRACYCSPACREISRRRERRRREALEAADEYGGVPFD